MTAVQQGCKNRNASGTARAHVVQASGTGPGAVRQPLRHPGDASTLLAGSLPLLGRVAAGEPILAIEQAEDTVKVKEQGFIRFHRISRGFLSSNEPQDQGVVGR